jgi:predicted nucleic acid-binding protein
MPKGKRRSRTFYIDSNIALDYITSRNRDTISVLDKIRERGWLCISCSFLAMELADYKKDSLFIVDKAIEKKWEMRKIIRETYNKDLKRGDFEKVFEWFNGFRQEYKNVELYDFLTTSDEWQTAQEISFNSNLNAPDAIHLTSALLGALKGYCQILVTGDQNFIREAKKIIDNYRMNTKLKVMTISEVRKKFFAKHK